MRRERGSIFIESLVAAAIVSLAVLAMLQSVTGSARRDKQMDDRRLATLVAQSQLASIGSAIPLAPGTQSGSDGPYVWTVTIQPYDGIEADHGAMLDVRVFVRIGGAREALASLHTLRIGKAS
jgi:type II secretion system protein I